MFLLFQGWKLNVINIVPPILFIFVNMIKIVPFLSSLALPIAWGSRTPGPASETR